MSIEEFNTLVAVARGDHTQEQHRAVVELIKIAMGVNNVFLQRRAIGVCHELGVRIVPASLQEAARAAT